MKQGFCLNYNEYKGGAVDEFNDIPVYTIEATETNTSDRCILHLLNVAV
jgi:hypothetical protein